MNINTESLVSITEANQNFSKVARLADTIGSVVILKNSMLKSAINSPLQSFAGEGIYPSLQHKAARLCVGLVKKHPFLDGNKRIYPSL